MALSLEDLRDFLPAAREYRFLNYAATAPLLKPGALAMQAIVQQNMEPLSKHFDQWLSTIESARNTVAGCLGANGGEIAFMGNTSMGLSTIAASLPWREGDRILYPAQEFPSNRFVWENLQVKGVRPEALVLPEGESLLEYLKKINLDRVRLVAVSAVSYLDGRREDIKALADFCRAHNILTAVDAIQAVGALELDVKAWGCDFLACGGQKWLLGPVGSGFLYIRGDLLEHLFVPWVGWASSRSAGVFDAPKLEFVNGARRFEPGLPDIVPIAGLARSIETLSSCGWPKIFQRVKEHQQRLAEALKTMGYKTLYSDPLWPSGIVSIELDSDLEAEKIHQSLEKERIIVTQSRRLNRRQLRVSAHATSSAEDIDVFLNILRKFRSPVTRTLTEAKPCNPVFGQSAPALPAGESLNPRALITGASRGLGEALAQELAARGYDLMLLGRDSAKLQSLAQRLEEQYEIKAEFTVFDFADRKAVETWLADSAMNWDFEVLINNAAMAEAELFSDTNLPRLRDMFETNYFFPLAVTQKILGLMLKKRQGRILNMVTSGARCSLPLFSAYSASKSALWAWSESLGREVLDKGITVTTFLPPHMESVTFRQLGRQALAYYKLEGHADLKAVNTVARKALKLLFSGKSSGMSWMTRLQLVFNVLMPDQITKQVKRRRHN